jgi:hypothetical protein
LFCQNYKKVVEDLVQVVSSQEKELDLKCSGKAHIDRWRISSRSGAKVIYVGDDGLKAILGRVVGSDTLAKAKLDDGGDCRAVIRDKDRLDSS